MEPLTLRLRLPIMLWIGSFMTLAALGWLLHINPLHPSYADHFGAQAEAWLHGKMAVPASLGHDLIVLHGQHYIVYPPLPALLMLPFVALLRSHFSDIPFTWSIGALNVTLMYIALDAFRRRGWARRTPQEQVVLAVTYGFGTIALWLTLGGAVWFTAQTLAITGLLVMIIGATNARWWLASAGIGAVFLTRSPDVLAIIFPLVLLARHLFVGRNLRSIGIDSRWRLRHMPWLALVLTGAPIVCALIIWMIHNQLLFGNPLSTGYDIQVRQDYPQIHYGLLSWHYIWPNAIVAFLNAPAFHFQNPFDVTPMLDILRGGNGIAIEFTTPLFLLLLFPQSQRPHRWLRRTLWACVGVLIAFSLLWNGTGWLQVGARYLFDAYPFLFLLLAMRQERIGPRWLVATGAGMWMNFALARAFWCQSGCSAVVGSLHWLATAAVVVAIPILLVLAGWWLHQERLHPCLRGELSEPITRIGEASQQPDTPLAAIGQSSLDSA